LNPYAEDSRTHLGSRVTVILPDHHEVAIALIKGNGFDINQLQTMYIPGWKPASFNYWGIAKIA